MVEPLCLNFRVFMAIFRVSNFFVSVLKSMHDTAKIRKSGHTKIAVIILKFEQCCFNKQ